MMVTPGPGVLSLAGVGAGFGWKVGMMYLIGLFFGTNGVALLIDKNNKTELEKLDKFLVRISERAIRMDGTCTGEHGVGQGKRKYMLKELGNAVNVMKSVKEAFDPHKIMNPGKLFL